MEYIVEGIINYFRRNKASYKVILNGKCTIIKAIRVNKENKFNMVVNNRFHNVVASKTAPRALNLFFLNHRWEL
ncbi:hypothetical protein LCGC14_1641880 [marine sediment metagenome]|uniref:Uncharacterized protein n=1 Tax=marine sediment metagenome TaxID=412755 RepID=A0A0F9ILU6_9ZZZZ